jgi:hypothetical protein
LVRVWAWGCKPAIELYGCSELAAVDETGANEIVDHGYRSDRDIGWWVQGVVVDK